MKELECQTFIRREPPVEPVDPKPEIISVPANQIVQKIFKLTKCQQCKDNLGMTDESEGISSIERVIHYLHQIIPEHCCESSLKRKLLLRIQSIICQYILSDVRTTSVRIQNKKPHC